MAINRKRRRNKLTVTMDILDAGIARKSRTKNIRHYATLLNSFSISTGVL